MIFQELCLGWVSLVQMDAPLHSSKFDPDEKAIAVGIKVITESIVKLNNEKFNTIGVMKLIKDLFYLLWLL